MINESNLPAVLQLLGFKSRGGWQEWGDAGARVRVNLTSKLIEYPEAAGLVVNERQTCNFSMDENFVVLDCVVRLLAKGYRPDNIELEPRWQLGRGSSGGRADVLVKDNQGKPLLLIECKTAGAEFKRAWAKTQQDGDQLFSYAQQISETRFLCLYTVDLEGAALRYTTHLISHRDNDRYLADNPLFKSFRSATDVKERFAVWRDTYKLDYTTRGLFEDNIQPYHIGKDKYTLDDLQTISAADQQGKYHQFATILRQHNVSGRENAFDKLVNLFLCKLVDETENVGDLKFYWKGVAYDTHFELLDRLQQLYQAGMGRFLGESITYINQDAVNNALRFVKQSPDATQRAVWNLFVQQKFFTNNDFSFIDVHNEKLFYQNAEVLLRILQMWQDVRLSNPVSHNQFLGDMFEGFLDQGVKQSEGQYFTPMPICRFILMSLPLPALVKPGAQPLKAIDYACGADHFLNELALQLKPLLEQNGITDPKPWHQAIYGIEKEYRLSKVAKVSAFMYGQQDINICYGDALVKQHAAYPGIEDGSFDLLVANPPFSVRGFLETLPETERAGYTLADTVDKLDTANSIETFFVERAKQLLKPGGVAGIILPSSVLSNANGSYARAREILLQYFDIVAIAELGSATFGKTGTNTVTLFLRRKPTTPDAAEHYRGRLSEWFAADENQAVYRDGHLIDAYAAHIGVPAADYRTLLKGVADGAWAQHDHFEAYKQKFNDSTDVNKLGKSKAFKALSAAEREASLQLRFLAFARHIERDKLYHFVMASDQQHPVLVIRAPADGKAQKAFLGYDWSAAKGDEGIKLVRDAAGRHLTRLYDEADRANPAKLNAVIAAAFSSGAVAPEEALAEFAKSLRLVDMLDFSRPVFDKQFNLSVSPATDAPTTSRWPMRSVESLLIAVAGPTTKIDERSIREAGEIPVVTQERHRLVAGYCEGVEPVSDLPLIVFGDHTCSFKYVDFPFVRGADGTQLMKPDSHLIEPKYMFYALSVTTVPNADKYERHYKYLKPLRIPVPDFTVQKAVVSEIEAIDRTVAASAATVSHLVDQVEAFVQGVYESGRRSMTPVDAVAVEVQYGLSEKMNEAGIGYKIFRMNEIAQRRMVDGGQMKYADISPDEFAKIKLNKGDILFNRTNSIEHVGKSGLFDLEGDYCFASYLVRVVPDRSQVLPEFLVLMMNSPAFLAEARSKAAKAINQANINATVMRNMRVPVPPLPEQKRLVAKVRKLEQQIADAQAVIAGAPARKQAILRKYL
jgi:type I restriction enzyme M protein